MKTSIWIPDDLAGERRRRGLTYAEVFRRGLAAGEPDPLDARIERIVESVVLGEAFELRLSRIVRDALARAAGEHSA